MPYLGIETETTKTVRNGKRALKTLLNTDSDVR